MLCCYKKIAEVLMFQTPPWSVEAFAMWTLVRDAMARGAGALQLIQHFMWRESLGPLTAAQFPTELASKFGKRGL